MSETMTEREFLAIKDKVAARKEDISKAQGRMEQSTANLKEQYGCATVEEGQTKVKELIQQQTEKDEVVSKLEVSLVEMKNTLNL